MMKSRTSYFYPLALIGGVLLSPSLAAAQSQGTGQASTQPPMSANGSAMPPGGMMEGHDAMPGMQGGMQMPKPVMAQEKSGCCAKKMKPMGRTKHSSRHRRHAKPAAAKPAPMPAAKPMPMQDDM